MGEFKFDRVCPKCGGSNEAYTMAGAVTREGLVAVPEHEPEPDDVMICWNCSCLVIIVDERSMRLPTAAELRAMPATVWALQAGAFEHKRRSR